MKHTSSYLDWYVHTPHVKYDFRSSGILNFKISLDLGETDLSVNYANGNPDLARLLAERYYVQPANVFISSEGASGQNVRVIKHLAETGGRRNEAIVEYPTYEPLLRAVQEYFPRVKRLERSEPEEYALDPDSLMKMTSEKTRLLVLTNPHAPSGAVSMASELTEVMEVAAERGFHVLCDEIYAEFDRNFVPTLFSVDRELGIVTTSFTKAYGLGGLKLGVVLAKERLVSDLYVDVLNTVGNSPNVVQLVAVKLLTEKKHDLETHKNKWMPLKDETERWLTDMGFKHFSSRVGLTYWVRLPIRDTYRWMNQNIIPNHSLAAVPGTFFLFRNDYELTESDMIRLSLGNIDPDGTSLTEGLSLLKRAIKASGTAC